MKLSDLTYHLPKESIAKEPTNKRGDSKLLVFDRATSHITDARYSDCIDYFSAGDVVVINNTKVVKARLIARDSTQKPIELVVLEKHHQDDFGTTAQVLYRGSLSQDSRLTVGPHTLVVEKILEGGRAQIRTQESISEIMQAHGQVPLPPYMKREATDVDTLRYQTTFAKTVGSVAAPTASLNMTRKLISQMKAKGVHVVELTLHVGLGTFLPIRTDAVEEHTMHSEFFSLPQESVEAIRLAKVEGRKIIAIGTTVARTLEYTAEAIMQPTSESIDGEADIFIYPGYKYKLVDMLLTNFHAPKSTVLLLAAAFAGQDNLLQCYKHALAKDYRFLSYGDSMLIV